MSSTNPSPSVFRRVGSLWYFVVPIVSLGMFAVVPFVHAAVRLRRKSVWGLVAVYGLLGAATFSWASVQGSKPEEATSPLDALVVVVALGLMVAACVQLGGLRREVFGLGRLRHPSAPPPVVVDPAIADVLAARARRQEARELAAKDPLMARDLLIGRPDLPGAYDDGGLVDLATAPAAAIATVCGLTPADAERIVAARGTFSNVDELFVMTELPVDAWERIRDRAVVIRA